MITRKAFVFIVSVLLVISAARSPTPAASTVLAPAVSSEPTREAAPEAPPAPAPNQTGPGAKSIPILMYHVIGDDNGAMKELYVREADFTGQMRYLKDAGYTAVTMTEVFRHWNRGEPLAEKPVVISFDDGYESVFRLARPILRPYGFRTTQFIISSFVGRQGHMDEAMIRQLVAEGHEIGSHTVSHPNLPGLSRAARAAELTRSRAELSAKFGVTVDFLCYPAGRYDQTTVEVAREAGYLGAVTTRYGLAGKSEPLALKRIRVNRNDGVAGFVAKMKALQ